MTANLPPTEAARTMHQHRHQQLTIGQIVDVNARMQPGVSRPGGTGIISKIRYSTASSTGLQQQQRIDSFDVKYTVLFFKNQDDEQLSQHVSSQQEDVIVRVLPIDTQEFSSSLGTKSKSMTDGKKKSPICTKAAGALSTVIEGDSGEETAATDNDTLSQAGSLAEYVSDLVEDVNAEGCQGVIQPFVNVVDDIWYMMNLVTAACRPSKDKKSDRKSRKPLRKNQQQVR